MTHLAVSVKRASAMTDISETTIRDAINKQALPAHRIGRQIRIRVSDLDEWFSNLPRVGSEEDCS